jgi:pSer/pThr/pTyr-binding forkhead associated (FHA) protein
MVTGAIRALWSRRARRLAPTTPDGIGGVAVSRVTVLSSAHGEAAAGSAAAGGATLGARIVHRAGGRTIATFDLRTASVVIGRGRHVAVAVQAPGISREHARLTWDGAAYWIEDLDSRNGTFVNGQAVPREGKERLRHLDVVALGRRVELLFLGPAPPVRVVKRVRVVRATLVPLEEVAPPYEIPAGESILGRSGGSHVVVALSPVSKVHARLQRTAEHLVVQDLGSSNGTFLNGARITAALLEDGDHLTLAGAVTYRVAIETAEAWSVLDGRPGPPRGSAVGRDTICEWDSGEDAVREEPPPDGEMDTAEVRWPPAGITEVRLAGLGIDLSVTEPGTYDIGRSPAAALRVDNPTVSRVQARLTLAADRGSARVEHAGTSASLLNGAPLDASAELRDGDLLQLGQVALVVRLERPAEE